MVPCDEESWRSILPLVEETGADGVELNFGCPHGMSERGMGSAVGQVPEYIEMVARWCKAHTRMPVIVKLTPNITDIRKPARAAHGRRRGRGQPDQHGELDHRGRPRQLQPGAVDRRQGVARRLLRAGGEADRAQHGGGDRARPGDRGPADLAGSAASPPGATRRSSSRWARGTVQVCTAAMTYGFRVVQEMIAGLGAVDGREGPCRSRRDPRAGGAERHRLAVPEPQLRRQGADRPGSLHPAAGAASRPARTPATRRSRCCRGGSSR